MRQVYKGSGRVAAREIPVIITGATGAGKERVARAMREHSDQAGRPIMALSATDGRSHVEALSYALEAFGKAPRKAIEQFNEFGDQDTAGVFRAVSRGIDRWLRSVAAHLQAERRPGAAAAPSVLLSTRSSQELCGTESW